MFEGQEEGSIMCYISRNNVVNSYTQLKINRFADLGNTRNRGWIRQLLYMNIFYG